MCIDRERDATHLPTSLELSNTNRARAEARVLSFVFFECNPAHPPFHPGSFEVSPLLPRRGHHLIKLDFI